MTDDFEPGFEADDTGIAPPSAVGIGVALGAADKNTPLAAEAREFLRKHSRYLDLQMEDLHEQRDLTLSHLQWRRFNDWMRGAWQASLALLALCAVAALAIALWDAHEAGGLVVQALKTPPDFAAKGLDGGVLAQRLLDKLNGLVVESEPVAFRSASSIRGDWGDESKVEIPQTGVSVGEFTRSLRNWLGHETHVTGEIWPLADGIAVTVRADGNGGATVTGKLADLDRLLDRAAEQILAQTQPYRYAAILDQRGRYGEAVVLLRRIARTGPSSDRAWAYTFWSNTLAFAGDNRGAIPLADMGIKLDPSDPSGYFSRLSAEANLGQFEPILRDEKIIDRLMAGGSTPATLSATAAAAIRPLTPVSICELAGDYACAAAGAPQLADLNFDGYQYGDLLAASNYARAHDGAAARALLAAHPAWNDGTAALYSSYIGGMLPNYFLLADVGQWRRAAADAAMADRVAQAAPALRDLRHSFVWPWLALAMARSGDVAGAETLIARTAPDCTTCVEVRGDIAEARGDFPAAAAWFARAIRIGPSIPFAATDWGAMLLHRGDLDGAIAKFADAHREGPHFADPLEMWGEALVAQDRSDLALAKFEEAARHAPNWGRLHLEWGEALLWLGRGDEAKRQFARAAALDLTTQDARILKALLAKV